MSQIRAVLVEKHSVMRAGIRYFLEKDVDIAVVSETGDELKVLSLIGELIPNVLILDMLLPNMLSFEIVSYLQTHLSTVRILALSEYDDRLYIAKILESGVAGCLLKDEIPEMIIEAVRAVTQNEDGWFSHRVTSKLVTQRKVRSTSIPIATLSNREIQIMQLLAKGDDNQKIAEVLKLSVGTVKNHITNIYLKIHAQTRAEAVAWAWQHGITYNQRDQLNRT